MGDALYKLSNRDPILYKRAQDSSLISKAVDIVEVGWLLKAANERWLT